MKVAILTTCYYPFIGGAEVFAQQVAEYMAEKGVEVDVITLDLDKNLNQLEVINNVTVHRIEMGQVRFLSYLAGFFRLLWYVFKLNKERDYDLIHPVGDGGLPLYASPVIQKLVRKPVLTTVQGEYTATGFGNDLPGRILNRIQNWSLKNTDLVHAISQSLAEGARRFGAQNIVVIPNGVDPQLFRPRNKQELRKSHGFSIDEKIVVCVANLYPVKGIDCLIRATALVTENIPDLRLIVVGEGPQRQELEELARRLNLSDRVHLVGTVPHSQIPDYLGMADVFVLPSRHEGLGVALIEAMACGIPAIGSNVDGIVDLIEHERNGILFPPGDEKELARAIERLLGDENLRRHFAEESLKKVKEGFLWSSILPRIDNLYADLIQNKKGD